MNEISADGVTGTLLYDPRISTYFFRVRTGDTYTDYALRVEDIRVTIRAQHLSLYKDYPEPGQNILAWSSNYLNG